MDVEELARALLNLSEDADSSEIETAICEKFDASFEQFHQIVEALVPLTPVVRTALKGTLVRGFIKDDCFIIKAEVEERNT